MLYPNFKDELLKGTVNLLVHDVNCVLSSSVFDGVATTIDDIVIGSRPTRLTEKTAIGGVFDAKDLSIQGLDQNMTMRSVILYNNGGVLIACIQNMQGLPFDNRKKNLPSISVTWNNYNNKIFRI